MKYICFNIFGVAFEYLGEFDYSREAWDTVLQNSLVGSLGILLGFGIIHLLNKNKDYDEMRSAVNVPTWYHRQRALLYSLLVLFSVALSIFNFHYKVHIIGLLPELQMPFFLSKVYSWLFLMGVIIVATTFLFWDTKLKKTSQVGFYVILFVASVTNTFRLSRGSVFHILPQALVIFLKKLNQNKLSLNKNFFVFASFFIVAFFVSMATVESLREKNFNSVLAQEKVKNKIIIEYSDYYGAGVVQRILKLSVTRWVGMEGIMGVVPFEGNMQSFQAALFDINQPNRAAYFDRVVLKSPYTDSNKGLIQFGSLPGPIAFFSISGSMFIIFAGIAFLTVIGGAVEICCWWLTKNPFMSSLVGANVGLGINQFGYQPLKFFAFLIVLLFNLSIIYFIQRKKDILH
ncbi:MAG: hypothetical protein H7235_10735 [Bdellovibrionaceae bacterium]|nr:hypothetical protein [Pseudobdellovibrionaceae bacterium]